jgi:hypothetical protein
MIRPLALVALFACVACGNALAPTRAAESAYVTDDALQARVGGPKPVPDSYETEDRVVSVVEPSKVRFAPTDPLAVKLIVGVDDEEAFIVLGIVSGGETGGLGDAPSYVAALKRAAAAIGADAVLDVHVEGPTLTGLAARRKTPAIEAKAW